MTAPSWFRFCIAPAQAPTYKINETDVAKRDLLPKLTEIYANRAERIMFVKGDDDVNFALYCRCDRYWQGGQRGSHRVDDAEDSWPASSESAACRGDDEI